MHNWNWKEVLSNVCNPIQLNTPRLGNILVKITFYNKIWGLQWILYDPLKWQPNVECFVVLAFSRNHIPYIERIYNCWTISFSSWTALLRLCLSERSWKENLKYLLTWHRKVLSLCIFFFFLNESKKTLERQKCLLWVPSPKWKPFIP